MKMAGYHMRIPAPAPIVGFDTGTHILISIRLLFLGQKQPLRWCLSFCGAPVAAESPLDRDWGYAYSAPCTPRKHSDAFSFHWDPP